MTELGQIANDVGARIRARRLMLGLTQERVAERLGVTYQQVQKCERGVNRISLTKLAAGGVVAVQRPFVA
jgi:transcriptional regulator with XRE-family HTH domain